jgi:sarcosine oxidase, subunit beta
MADHGQQHHVDHVDAIIIGAGVIGAALALELSRRGHRTLNLDKLPASGYGSTSNSCAIVRFSYSTVDGVAMAYEGARYWQHWSEYLDADDERGHAHYHQCGSVILMGGDGHAAKVLPLYDEVGVPYEVWDLDELARRQPSFRTGSFHPPTRPDSDEFWAEPTATLAGAVFTPESGYVSDPQLATHNLQVAAEALGATFRFGAEVAAIGRTGDGRGARVTGVTLGDGTTITAPVVVNVAGPHSFVINRMAGLEGTMAIGTRALRHEVHHVPAPDGVDFEGNGHHVSDGDSGIYFRPETGNHILIGSEDPECDPRVWIEDPDVYDREITGEQWEAQVLRLSRRMEGLGMPGRKRGVVDLYDVSDDWIPIYDRTDLDGFYVAIGTSGNQFKNAPIVGHCMAELIEAVEGGRDHDAEPLTVTGPYTGLELDLGFYRRNRAINPDSSFSVNG